MLPEDEATGLRSALENRGQSVEIVVAHALNGVIGAGLEIPWKISADLQHFKQTTMGGYLLMGRRTWQSIGRALPGRTTCVLSGSALDLPPQVLQAANLKQAIGLAEAGARIFAVGGADVYRHCWAIASRCHVSLIKRLVGGDVRFHALALLDGDEWEMEARRELAVDAELFVFRRRHRP